MKVVSLNCPTCGAPLNDVKPNVEFTCASCGSTLLLTEPGGEKQVSCAECGAVNVNLNRYCCRCGAQLQVTCPACGEINNAVVEFCAKCGEDLSVAYARTKVWLEEKRRRDEERVAAWKQAEEENQKAELDRLMNDLDEPENHPLAIYCLCQFGTEAVNALVRLLKDNDPDARYGAAHTLGLIGDTRAIPALAEALKDTVPAVRFWAVDALGKLRADDAVEEMSYLLKDPDKSVQKHAFEVLKSMGTPAAEKAVQAAKRFPLWPFG